MTAKRRAEKFDSMKQGKVLARALNEEPRKVRTVQRGVNTLIALKTALRKSLKAIERRVPPRDAQALDISVRLMQRGEFDRLKQCQNCNAWLFAARRRDQEYCSKKCRQAQYEKTEERKKQNRERAQKDYRKLFPKAKPYRPRKGTL